MPSELELLEHLYAALRSPLGVVIETDDPEYLRQKLYPMRKKDPDFSILSFIISPMNGMDLWILRKPDNAEERTAEAHPEPFSG